MIRVLHKDDGDLSPRLYNPSFPRYRLECQICEWRKGLFSHDLQEKDDLQSRPKIQNWGSQVEEVPFCFWDITQLSMQRFRPRNVILLLTLLAYELNKFQQKCFYASLSRSWSPPSTEEPQFCIFKSGWKGIPV